MSTRLNSCPVCGKKESQLPLVSIEGAPVFCNVLLPSRKIAASAPRGDIQLVYCGSCGHVYNGAFDPSKIDYNPSYENSLHFSPSFQAYAESLAARLVTKYDLKGKTVLEIGCGKGDFLKLLCKQGVGRGLGFDPSFEETQGTESDGGPFSVVRDYYSEKYADIDVDMVVCRHVLEHIASPNNFLDTIRRTVEARGATLVFFEVPNVMYTLKDLGIWDLIYEHCGYFTAPSLIHLFRAAGFFPVSVRPEFGGQYLCIEAYPAKRPDKVFELPREELVQLSACARSFAVQYRNKIEAWQRTLGEMKHCGRKAVVWGGGSKGVTFLNAMRDHSQIDFVVDINPRKLGLYVPGTGQRVISPDELIDYRPDVVIVMNPLYAGEVRQLLTDRSIQSDLMVV